jgi:tetratricopeptide (TPR) repeat protein
MNALGHRVLAEALFLLEPSDPAGAEHAISEAIRILQEIGTRPELARTYVSYARLLKARGEREKAREFFANAIDMFCDMGMAWDEGQAEQALRES